MSENKKGYSAIIEGFVFTNQTEAEQAGKEAEGVRYIRQRTNMDDPNMVLSIYNKMIRQNLFETAVGFSYLKDLQDYLRSIPFICQEDILPIPVQHPALVAAIREVRRTAGKKQRGQAAGAVNIDYKQRCRLATFFAGILAVCVVAMFVITATANSTTILNYETRLIDKYASWEQELTERETAVKEMERSLGISQE